MNNMQHMVVIPTEVFHKLKQLIDDNKNLSILDQNMKKILYTKNLNNLQKWYMYRQNLMKYGNQKRQTAQLPSLYTNKNEDSINSRNAKTQTRFVKKQDIGTQYGELIAPYNKLNPSININKNASVFTFDPVEDKNQYRTPISYKDDDDDNVFWFNPAREKQEQQQYRDSNQIDDDIEMDQEFVSDEEEKAQNLALEQTLPHERLSRRLSSNANVRMFDTNTGDIITVALPEKQSPTKTRHRSQKTGTFLRQSILSKYPDERTLNKRKLAPISKLPSPNKVHKKNLTPPHWTAYK